MWTVQRRALRVASILLLLVPPAVQPDDQVDLIRLRRPVALALVDGGKRLLAANRDSGTISVIDTERSTIINETRVGRRLSDLTVAESGERVLALDEADGTAVLLAYDGGKLRALRRLATGMTPMSATFSDDARRIVVACLWPRRLVIHDVDGDSPPAFIDLPFAPRQQLPIRGANKLIVADAFAGALAVVDVRSAAVESLRTLPMHNVRGLALDRHGKHLLLTHQSLNAQARTTTNDILTGNLLSNHLRKLPLADLLMPGADVQRAERVYSLGDVERGAGDPEAVAETAGGDVIVAVGGVDEVVVGRPEEVLWTRLRVGRRPTAVALDGARGRAYVANTFADSISVINVAVPKVIATIALGQPTAELLPQERGELLFFDARLSFESWFSCQSCHGHGHTSGRLNDNFSDGSFGTPKRILTLLGARDTGPWAWNAQLPHLEEQVRASVKSTMQGAVPSDDQVRDLVAFVQSLPPPPGLLRARGQVDDEAFKRGRHIFAAQKCATCHTPPAYTSAKTFDVGLRDEIGGHHFNPPSLRGVSQGGPYFHDGRAQTLEEVFRRFRHQLSGELSAQELQDLLHYLATL
jgi:YVTN family beta-propeller protein